MQQHVELITNATNGAPHSGRPLGGRMTRILMQFTKKAFVAVAAARSAGELISPAQQSCAALGFVQFVIELTHCKLSRVFIMLLTITEN